MMDEPKNILEFKQMSGRILGSLYAVHPRAIFIDPESFFDADISDDEDTLFYDTVSYPSENGYLTKTDKNSHIRLNDRSYAILEKPDPLAPKEPIGKTLSVWAKEATSETAKAGLTQAAGAALTLLYTLLKSGG